MNFSRDIYNTLRNYCTDNGLIYFPTMYDEYMAWSENHDNAFSYEDVCAYATYSTLFQEQRAELDTIRKLEQIAQIKHIRFYDGDSIIEKVSLAAMYLRTE